ncbi:MAG: hypothetical protein GF398_15415 [Chitinivibrionales bacterium]|nr:hypothetical protein [Chitinivibrionales bacterium]
MQSLPERSGPYQCPTCSASPTSMQYGDVCRMCGTDLQNSQTQAAKPAWEQLDNTGIAFAFGSTVSLTLMRPGHFFERINSQTDAFMAWLFALAAGGLGALLQFGWAQLICATGFKNACVQKLLPGGIHSTYLIAYPLIVSFSLLYLSWIVHGMLRLFTGTKGPWRVTLQVFAYSHSTWLLYAIPYFGGFLASAWSLVVIIIGLHKAHRISVIRVIVAFILPTLIFLVIMGIVLIVLVSSGAVIGEIFKEFLLNYR